MVGRGPIRSRRGAVGLLLASVLALAGRLNVDARLRVRELHPAPQEQENGAGCRSKPFEDAGEGWQLKAADILVPAGDGAPPVFGKGFVWGAATAAYQIEGGADADGRGQSIWDTFSHTPGKVAGNATGDVACGSYHQYEEDVKLLKELGVSHYRFSVSWPRVIPGGTGEVNRAGLDYYDRLIDALVKEGIEPAVTLYHWDLPQALQDKGGWQSQATVDAFAAYADVVFGALGDRVKMWFTLNEPWSTAVLGHGLGNFAPGISDQRLAVYEAGHYQLLAHAAAAKVYKEHYQSEQKGEIGIVLSTQFKEPMCDTNPADVAAAERNLQFYLGWFAAPIFKGDYPAVMRERVGDRLPTFTEAQKEDLKGSVDFLGLNTYSSSLVTDRLGGGGGYFDDVGTKSQGDPSWTRGESSWLWVAPAGMRKLLQWVKNEYDSPPIYVTENGFDVAGESELEGEAALDDQARVDYLTAYLAEVGKAIRFDKVDVRGYMVWSLLDNFEWSEGYRSRFGLVHVDYETVDRMRTPKASFHYFGDVIRRFRAPSPGAKDQQEGKGDGSI